MDLSLDPLNPPRRRRIRPRGRAKSDREIDSIDVTAKAEAARRWVNYVNGSDKAPAQWKYLLLSETDIAQCKESWAALKRLRRE